jgi:hypothetical protein
MRGSENRACFGVRAAREKKWMPGETYGRERSAASRRFARCRMWIPGRELIELRCGSSLSSPNLKSAFARGGRLLDDHLHIVPQLKQKLNEAINGKAIELAVDQSGNFRLVHA